MEGLTYEGSGVLGQDGMAHDEILGGPGGT